MSGRERIFLIGLPLLPFVCISAIATLSMWRIGSVKLLRASGQQMVIACVSGRFVISCQAGVGNDPRALGSRISWIPTAGLPNLDVWSNDAVNFDYWLLGPTNTPNFFDWRCTARVSFGGWRFQRGGFIATSIRRPRPGELFNDAPIAPAPIAGVAMGARPVPAATVSDTLVRPWWIIVVPLWEVAALTAVPALVRFWLVLRRRRWARVGCCPQCGYDLRCSTDQCPECGTGRPEAAPLA